MEEPANEIEILRSALCIKDHEIFALRNELERRTMDMSTLAIAIERSEKTAATCYERLMRRLDRLERRLR